MSLSVFLRNGMEIRTLLKKTQVSFDIIFINVVRTSVQKEPSDLKSWILNKFKILEANADIDVANGMEGGNISPSPGKHPEPLGKIRRWQPSEYLTIS